METRDRSDLVRRSLEQLQSLEEGLSGVSKLFHLVAENLRQQMTEIASLPQVEGVDAVAVRAELTASQAELASLRAVASERAVLEAEVTRLREALANAAASTSPGSSDRSSAIAEAAVEELKKRLAGVMAENRRLQAAEAVPKESAQELAALRQELESLRAAGRAAADANANPAAFKQLEDDFERVRSDNITAWDKVHALEQEAEALKHALDSAQSDGISAWDRVFELEQERGAAPPQPQESPPAEIHQRLVEYEDEIASLRSMVTRLEAQSAHGAAVAREAAEAPQSRGSGEESARQRRPTTRLDPVDMAAALASGKPAAPARSMRPTPPPPPGASRPAAHVAAATASPPPAARPPPAPATQPPPAARPPPALAAQPPPAARPAPAVAARPPATPRPAPVVTGQPPAAPRSAPVVTNTAPSIPVAAASTAAPARPVAPAPRAAGQASAGSPQPSLSAAPKAKPTN
jgi:hypothetical protein